MLVNIRSTSPGAKQGGRAGSRHRNAEPPIGHAVARGQLLNLLPGGAVVSVDEHRARCPFLRSVMMRADENLIVRDGHRDPEAVIVLGHVGCQLVRRSPPRRAAPVHVRSAAIRFDQRVSPGAHHRDVILDRHRVAEPVSPLRIGLLESAVVDTDEIRKAVRGVKERSGAGQQSEAARSGETVHGVENTAETCLQNRGCCATAAIPLT